MGIESHARLVEAFFSVGQNIKGFIVVVLEVFFNLRGVVLNRFLYRNTRKLRLTAMSKENRTKVKLNI